MKSKNTTRAMLAGMAIVAAFLVMLMAPAIGADKPMDDMGGGMGMGMMYNSSNPPIGLEQVKQFAGMASANMMDKKYMEAMCNLHLATWVLEEGLGMHMGMGGMMGGGMMGGGMMGGMGMGNMGGGMGMGMGNMMGGMGMGGQMDCMKKQGMKDGSPNKEKMKEKDKDKSRDKDPGKGMPQDKMMSGGMMGMGGMPMCDMMNMPPMGADQAMALVNDGITALDSGKYIDACRAFHSAMYIMQAGKMMAMMANMSMGDMNCMGEMAPMVMPPSSAPAPMPMPKKGY
jgi:hypothetical protein